MTRIDKPKSYKSSITIIINDIEVMNVTS